MTLANGVLFAGTMISTIGGTPSMFAIDAKTGQILTEFEPFGSGKTIGRVTVSDGVVFWGMGYKDGPSQFDNRLLAFALPNKINHVGCDQFLPVSVS